MSVSRTGPLTVVVVDDHRLLAQSIAISLRQQGIDCWVAPLTDPSTLVDSVVRRHPDVVLLDLDLGEGVGDGGALVGPLVEGGCRVVVVSGSTDPERLATAIEAGAAGVLSKTEPIEALLAGATAAARGEQVMTDARTAGLMRDARRRRLSRSAALMPFQRLTAREAQVLRALGNGLSVATIATQWSVAEATVRSQVRGVLTKLDAGSQLEAVALAHRTGWLSVVPE